MHSHPQKDRATGTLMTDFLIYVLIVFAGTFIVAALLF
jgi:hypothetical protein